jgi:hypothetical protein
LLARTFGQHTGRRYVGESGFEFVLPTGTTSPSPFIIALKPVSLGDVIYLRFVRCDDEVESVLRAIACQLKPMPVEARVSRGDAFFIGTRCAVQGSAWKKAN